MPGKANEELSRFQSEMNFRDTLESMIEGCQIIGYDWRYLFLNESAARHGRLPKNDLIGRTMMECYPGIEDTPMFAELQHCMHDRTRHRMESEFTYPDGHVGWFELSIQPVPDGILVLSIDVTEKKLAQKHIEYQLRKLRALRRIDQSIVNNYDVRLTLDVVVDVAISLLEVDAAAVLLFDSASNMLKYAAGIGFRTNRVENGSVGLGEGLAGYAALNRTRLDVPNLSEANENFTRAALFDGEDIVSYHCVPLLTREHIVGVLEVFNRTDNQVDDEWLEYLDVLAGQAAIAVDSAQSHQLLLDTNFKLTLAYDATIEGWSRAMDLRDEETEGHTQRVTELTVEIARAMGLMNGEIVHIKRGALLHDMGKLGVPDAILQKPGKLTDTEWAIMHQHPGFAYEMLKPIEYLRPALEIPYCHHEKWDGSGYPRGLKGEEIPLAARIFAIVDVWDALRSDRPYRDAWPKEKVLEYIHSLVGSHFDPKVAEVFFRVIENDSN